MAESNGHATAEDLKAKYLGAPEVHVEAVEDVPEWGTVWLRSPNLLECDQFDAWLAQNKEGARAYLLSKCLCTQDGTRLDFTLEEMFELGRKSAHICEPLVDACLKLKNGVSLEELAKNSGATPGGPFA